MIDITAPQNVFNLRLYFLFILLVCFIILLKQTMFLLKQTTIW